MQVFHCLHVFFPFSKFINCCGSVINQTFQKAFLLTCPAKGHDIYKEKRKSYTFINLIVIAAARFLEKRFYHKDKLKDISTNYI